MDRTTVDGIVFSDMITGALGVLKLHEKEIDDLNVFPVPDGDTGANMRRTLELGIQSAVKTENLGEYAEQLSSGMLLGARGNSGVILSQIFKGVSVALQGKATASAIELLDAFSVGYQTAYDTVYNPVEGTILTVLREGVNATKAKNFQGIEEMLERLLVEMKAVLDKTPELLAVLKEAGVVDSGGFGLVKIVEGMLAVSRGEDISYEPTAQAEKAAPDLSTFDENSAFEFGYCMEFILQLSSSKTDVASFSKQAYTEKLSAHGNSIVVILDKSRVRVHIHTFTPETVISISRGYGEFVFFKLENMALQHNETVAQKKNRTTPHKELEIISVVNGGALADLFAGLGCGITISDDAGASVQDFLTALESANADTVVLLPNDKNAVQTANQAVQMYQNNQVKVEVIPTRSLAEGYFALASDVPDAPVEERISSIQAGAACVSTVSVSKCARSRQNNGIQCEVGDYVSFVDGKLVNSNKDLLQAILVAMRAVKEIDEKESALAFVGKIDGIEEIIEALQDEFASLEIDVIDEAFSQEKLVIGIY